jgi:hypothetical protein
MILEFIQTILVIPFLILQYVVYAGVIAIYIGHPITSIVIFLGPFGIPAIYTIYLCVEENIKTAIKFLLIASLALAVNYGTGYLLQTFGAASRRRRGVDLTWIAFSMYGLIISIILVAISIALIQKRNRAIGREARFASTLRRLP